jgi:SEC-C motif-containing protein
VKRRPAAPAPCPCGSGAALADCCARYFEHWADGPAPSAEALMRSRYSAFVLLRPDYLQATWHASTRPATLDCDPGQRWLGLQVRAARSTGADQAEVEFIARWREAGGRAQRLHERSRFVREGGRWYYVDGDFLD